MKSIRIVIAICLEQFKINFFGRSIIIPEKHPALCVPDQLKLNFKLRGFLSIEIIEIVKTTLDPVNALDLQTRHFYFLILKNLLLYIVIASKKRLKTTPLLHLSL